MHGRLARSFIGATTLFVLPHILHAHVVSISTGELRVDGPTAVYELRIPIYEVANIQNPETIASFDHIHFLIVRYRNSIVLPPRDGNVCLYRQL